MTTPTTVDTYQVRWLMSHTDLAAVTDLERHCFDAPWSHADFVKYSRRDGAHGLVAVRGRELVGYVLFESRRKRAVIDNLAVAPGHRRRRVGSSLLNALLPRLYEQGCRRVTAAVRETDLPTQLFLRASGFKAHVLRGYFHDPAEDAYEFEHLFRRPAGTQPAAAAG